MDNKANLSVAKEQPTTGQNANLSTRTSAEVAGREPRQAYGTAKTENLRDSGLWRIFLFAIIIAGCLSLLTIPLIVLVPLLTMALDPHSPSGPAGVQLAWLWVTMIIIVLSCAIIIVQGLLKILKPA